MRKGNLFVISGPSGAGKGTLVALLSSSVPDAWVSVSATTRKPREGEQDGKDYFFLSREEFERLIAEDELLEWAEYSGNYYGTPLSNVLQKMEEGRQVILEIEVQGAKQIKEKIPQAKLIFIEPPSFDELERRLRHRNTETEASIKRRLETAKLELSAKEEYDIQLVNDNLEEAAAKLASYIEENAG